MKVYFDDDQLGYFYVTPLDKIKGKQEYPKSIIKQFKKKIQLLKAERTVSDLQKHKALKFEYLKGNRKGQCSIRLNDQYRLVFIKITANEIAVSIIEISKHYE